MLIDSHCHLDRLDLSPFDNSLEHLLSDARSQGVGGFLAVGIDLESSRTLIKLARAHDDVFVSVGVHPLQPDSSDSSEGSNQAVQPDTALPEAALPDTALPEIDTLLALAQAPEVVAIGETGLDCHYGVDTLDWQRQSFLRHAEASRRCRKPLIVHTREARAETLEVIRAHTDPEVGGVLHCFTEDWAMAKAALEHNFYISFSGIVTFRNAVELREVVKKIPLDRLLIETDSPWLAPVPYRGKSNLPQYVSEVARCVAELRGMTEAELEEVVCANFERLFGVSLVRR
ncbi:MAG: TatD family hydrolase [Porticoccaceae bacterium]